MTAEKLSEGAPGDEVNDLIPLMLGAMRLLDEFVATLEARANAETPPTLDVNDPLVAAALGLISFRRSLRRWRLHAVHDHPFVVLTETAPEDLLVGGVSLR